MSGAPQIRPPTRKGIPVDPLASAPQADLTTQGMIAPMNQFVDADGVLTGISFRFLYGLYSAVQKLIENAGISGAGQFSASRSTAVPPGQGSTGAILIGAGVEFVAPQGNSRAFIAVDGQMGCNSAGGTCYAIISWGTGPLPPWGTPPNNLIGQLISYVSPTANAVTPFSESVILPGLTAGGTYWVDLAAGASTGGSIVNAVDLNVFGLIDQ